VSANALVNLSTREFLNRLASEASTPGGGSVAALTAALATGLGRMACALTLGKERFADVAPAVRDLASRLQRADAMLQELIDEDAVAYEQLAQAFRRGASASGRQSDPARRKQIAAAAGVAAGVPLQTLALAVRVRRDLEHLASVCNPNLKPDVDAGIHLALAAMQAAAANIHANLPFLPEAKRETVRAELEQLLATSDPSP
jgi:formiminotetrahydrofolate cyclodeaminase